MRGQRRGASGDSSVERRAVNTDIGERHRGPYCGARHHDRRPGKLGKINVRLRDAGAAHADGNRVSAWVARRGLQRPVVLVARLTVMVKIDWRWMIVMVRGRPVVVIRVIVPDVLVYMQRRRYERRPDQGENKHECDDPAHEHSLLRCRAAGSRANYRA